MKYSNLVGLVVVASVAAHDGGPAHNGTDPDDYHDKHRPGNDTGPGDPSGGPGFVTDGFGLDWSLSTTISDQDIQCAEIAGYERLVEVATNTTELNLFTHNNSTLASSVSSQAAGASSSLSTLTQNATLTSACSSIKSMATLRASCDKIMMLEDVVTQSPDASSISAAASGDASIISQISSQLSSASSALSSLQANATLTSACSAYESSLSSSNSTGETTLVASTSEGQTTKPVPIVPTSSASTPTTQSASASASAKTAGAANVYAGDGITVYLGTAAVACLFALMYVV